MDFYDNPKCSKSWIDPGQSSTSTPKPKSTPRRFCSVCGGIGVLRVVTTRLNNHGYQQQLTNLSNALEEKRPFTGQGRRKVILLHNNARPHVAKASQNRIFALRWELLPHAAYIPDIAPSDYYLFRLLQHHLTDIHFVRFEEIRKWNDDFIASKWWVSVVNEFASYKPERWQNVLDANREYVAKALALD